MKDELVYVKSNYINYSFRSFGEYQNTTQETFNKAIEHKIFVSTKFSETVRDNKKLLCSFLTIRVLGDNTLMTFVKEKDKKCIVIDIPVMRGMFKKNQNDLAFVDAVKEFLSPYLSMEDLRKTHLRVSGVLNYGTAFGIHYNLYITPEIEKRLRKNSEFMNGKSYRISELQSDTSLDGISRVCINNYKEVIPDGKNNKVLS